MKFNELMSKCACGRSKIKIVTLYNGEILGEGIGIDEKTTDFSKLIEKDINRNKYKGKLEALLLDKNNFAEIMFDIFIKDGNSIMTGKYFSNLYAKEKDNLDALDAELKIDELSDKKRVYLKCVEIAFNDKVLSLDEQTILTTLGRELGLSKEEIKLLDYHGLKKNIPTAKEILEEGAKSGVLLYNGTNPNAKNIFIPDEVVEIMREIRGKKIADKHFRLLLWNLYEKNNDYLKILAKDHGINHRGKKPSELIQNLIEANIDLHSLIMEDFPKLYGKEGIKGRDLNNFVRDTLSDLIEDFDSTKGTTANEKIDNLITYFKKLDEKEAKIPNDGYQHLLKDFRKEFEDRIKEKFELEELPENPHDLLQLFIDLNIKPSDLLFSLSVEELKKFAKDEDSIKTKGISKSMVGLVEAILNSYMDKVDVYIENYVDMANQRYGKLDGVDQNNIGQEFEKATAEIFKRIGFDNEKESCDCKVDILIKVEGEPKIIECKTKEGGLYKDTTKLFRQIKDYSQKTTYPVIVIAPEFSENTKKEFSKVDKFSLLKAEELKSIYDKYSTGEIKKNDVWGEIWSKCIGK